MTPLAIAQCLLEDTYKYAFTSIDAPSEVADFIHEWGRLNIPDDVLAKDGREDHIHVTVKYGLTTQDLPVELKQIAKTTKPFPIFMGVVSLFTTSPEHDVVKIDVESPALRLLNRRICDALPHEDTHPDYHPHLTLAYVQKGTCDHLVGDDPFKAEGVAREFMAHGMVYKGAGDEDDPARVQDTLLFSKGDRPDPAVEEAVLRPSDEDTEAVMAAIRQVADKATTDREFVVAANHALEAYGVQFGGAVAQTSDEGIFLPEPHGAIFKDRGWQNWVRSVLHHEGVHAMQLDRSQDPKRMYQSAMKYMVPQGRLDQDRYLQQKQEIMAWAASMVDSWRRQGLTSDQMMGRLRSGNWGFGMKYWANRRDYPQAFNRFVKQATEYIEQLKEAAIDSLPVPDPFGGIGFPADPDQTRQFLRSNGKRRVERSIL